MIESQTAAECLTVLAGIDRIADVAYGVNQRRITELFSQPTDEHFDQLRVVFMRVFPNAFAQFCSRKGAAEFPMLSSRSATQVHTRACLGA